MSLKRIDPRVSQRCDSAPNARANRLSPRTYFNLSAACIAAMLIMVLSSCTPLPTESPPTEPLSPESPPTESSQLAAAPTTPAPLQKPGPKSGPESDPDPELGSIGRNNFKSARPSIKSVILLIGDGMGVEQAKAASLYVHGVENALFMHSAPYQNLVHTNNSDQRVTDSAAAATAMATGQKVENRILSLDADGQPLETALEFFQKRCKSTGIVATSYINHATPAAFAAHQPDRAMLSEIAAEILTQTRPNLLLGGTAEGITAAAAEAAGYTVVRDRTELFAVPNTVRYLSGQFSQGNMAYEYEHTIGLKPYYDWQPHLSEMTRRSLEILSQDPDGFFLMVEGSRIDHAAHANALPHTLFEVIEFDKTVQTIVEWANGRTDVLVVATSDHETGGLTVVNAAGPQEFSNVSWTTGQHTGRPVPIFGWNVQHPDAASNDIDNTFIYRLVTHGFDAPTAECTADLSSAVGTSVSEQRQQILEGDTQVHLPIMVTIPE